MNVPGGWPEEPVQPNETAQPRSVPGFDSSQVDADVNSAYQEAVQPPDQPASTHAGTFDQVQPDVNSHGIPDQQRHWRGTHVDGRNMLQGLDHHQQSGGLGQEAIYHHVCLGNDDHPGYHHMERSGRFDGHQPDSKLGFQAAEGYRANQGQDHPNDWIHRDPWDHEMKDENLPFPYDTHAPPGRWAEGYARHSEPRYQGRAEERSKLEDHRYRHQVARTKIRKSNRSRDQHQVQIVIPKERKQDSMKGISETMQMMMMKEMMSQQMAQQQMQMVQMNNMMGKSAVSGSGGKRPKKPAVNIKTKQLGRNRAQMPIVIAPPQPPPSVNTIESTAMENWQEATIILCIAIVGVIYLVISRSGKEEEKDPNAVAKHLVPPK